MPRSLVPVEVRNFVGGLVSDASPLTFPDNASLDEDNMVLNSDGSRYRRLGMDIEGSSINSGSLDSGKTVFNSYLWESAGGDTGQNIIVIQVGGRILFFDGNSSILSDGYLNTFSMGDQYSSNTFSFTSVDGVLIVAIGSSEVHSFYWDGSSLTMEASRLKIRDLFGVEEIIDGKDMKDGNNVSLRTASRTDALVYNRRNQGFGVPRVLGASEDVGDPLAFFYTESGGLHPSNGDSVALSFYADANDGDNRNVKRFFANNLVKEHLGTSQAATGYFIIDALSRGTSRLDRDQDNRNKFGELTIPVNSLPLDMTMGGASVVEQFAGRVFYSGFSGEVVDGDGRSPRMSSYVLFSQLVESPTNISKCYQVADPTSTEDPELVATDGGFIRIDESYGIVGMKPLLNSLVVFAKNGVWQITGSDSKSGFSATGYSVNKLSKVGCISAGSIVAAEDVITYWAEDGIYVVRANELGDLSITSLTANRLQNFYNDIDSLEKTTVSSVYDRYEKKVRWIYNAGLFEVSSTRELVFDLQINAFYTNTIYSLDGSNLPKVVGCFNTPPIRVTPGTSEVVTSGGDSVVTSSSDPIIVGTQVREEGIKQVSYFAVTYINPFIEISFCSYSNGEFKDWESVDGVGVDAYAYLVTGYISGGDFQRTKTIPYLTAYMKKTETGFIEDLVSGDFNPVNTSSILASVRWDWTNSASSNKWGTAREVYRHKRAYFPADVSDTFDDGNLVVVTRNKLRGSGRVMSLKFDTSPGKDFFLYGWSMLMGANQNV